MPGKSGLQGGVTLSCEAAWKSRRVACDYAWARAIFKDAAQSVLYQVDGAYPRSSGSGFAVALGFAFVERLCRVLGYRLQVSQVTPGSQRIELICDPESE